VRAFEKTHPRFRINLGDVGPEFWLCLGEAVSKCEHLARVPLRPATAEKLHQLYLAKGAAATTAIEGNTLSEDEVLRAVEGRLEVPPSKEYQKQEVENIIVACNRISEQIMASRIFGRPVRTGSCASRAGPWWCRCVVRSNREHSRV
jgi:hypothetical protein